VVLLGILLHRNGRLVSRLNALETSCCVAETIELPVR
jgi:hypothetical protein